MFNRKYINLTATTLRLAVNDFKAEYSGTFLGALWSLAEPLVTILVYWFVYTIAFGGNDIDGIPYYLWLSVGISLWFFISNGICSTANCYIGYSYLVKKTMFKKALLPIIKATSSFISHLIFMIVTVLICCVTKFIPAHPIALIFVLFISYLFVYSIGRIFAILSVKFKDTSNILSVIFNIGFWLVPIFWNIKCLPENLSNFIYINPVAIIVDIYRFCVFDIGNISIINITYLFGLIITLLSVGYFYERRAILNLADNL